ncbi:hypothetical protein LC612_08315 [Nostoc sp. CHAB 5834]|nr:hypothetical protein [Nostoc sp. CHAB 5834]
MKPAVSHPDCDEYQNISLNVILDSETSYPIQCSRFYIYSKNFAERNPYNALAQIDNLQINPLKRLHQVYPNNYTTFIDEDRVTWEIVSRQEMSNETIPNAPGWLFYLKRKEE